jgi:hypothetical protein
MNESATHQESNMGATPSFKKDLKLSMPSYVKQDLGDASSKNQYR